MGRTDRARALADLNALHPKLAVDYAIKHLLDVESELKNDKNYVVRKQAEQILRSHFKVDIEYQAEFLDGEDRQVAYRAMVQAQRKWKRWWQYNRERAFEK